MISAQEEQQQMLALRAHPRHDATPVDGTSTADLDDRLTSIFLRNARSASRRLAGVDDTTVLRRKRVLEPQGPRLTLGGLYALGQYPQQYAPNLVVTCAVVPTPGSPDRLIDLVHLDGGDPRLAAWQPGVAAAQPADRDSGGS